MNNEQMDRDYSQEDQNIRRKKNHTNHRLDPPAPYISKYLLQEGNKGDTTTVKRVIGTW